MTDEEKNKRIERAKELTNSINENILNSNYNSIINNTKKSSSDEEQTYLDREKRAMDLTNLVNPKLSDSNTIVSNEEEPISMLDASIDTKEDEGENKKEEKGFGDKALYVAKKTGLGVLGGTAGIAQAGITETADNLEKGSEKSFSENVGNFTSSILGLFNPLQSISGAVKNIPNYIKDTIGVVIDNSKSPLEKITTIALNANTTAIENTSIKKLFNSGLQLAGTSKPNASETVMELNNKITKPIEQMNQNLAEEGEQYGGVTKLLGDVGQQVGNMIPSIAASMITKNAGIGLATMGISAKGQSTQEALNKGAELDEAIKIGNAKGMIEIGTEMLTGGINIFGKGALDDIVEKGIIDKVTNNVAKFFVKQGIDASGEVIEETISDIVDTIIDKGTVDPEASYSIKDWGNTALETVLTTFALNILTGGLIHDINEINNNDSNKKIDVTENPEIGTFYSTKFNQEGTLESIEPTFGKDIQNINKKVKVKPVIIKNAETNTYNIIDGNTGLALDTSSYTSLIQAEQEFNHKIINLDEASIKGINDKIAKSNIAINNELNNAVSEIEQLLANNNVLNSRENVQNKNIDTLDNETSNYIVNIKNKQNNDINTNIKINEEVLDAYSGQVNNKMTATIDEKNVGTLEYSVYDNKPSINMINVDSKYRRQGIATQMLKELQKQYPNTEINWGMLTSDGSKLKNAITYNIDNQEILAKKKQIENINKKIAKYQEKFNNGVLTEQEGENWNKLTDKINNLQKDIDGKSDFINLVKVEDMQSVKKDSKIDKQKYKNATDLIKEETKKAEQNFKTDININSLEDLKNIDFKRIKENDYIKLSKEIFKENITKRVFYNKNSNIKIKVILEDIKESSYKAFNSKYQKKYIKEHIEVLSQIDKIIEGGTEVSTNKENKNREKYENWRYFTSQALIEGKPFLVQFDVAKKSDGYHFRLQRLVELNINNTRGTTLAVTNKQVGANSR